MIFNVSCIGYLVKIEQLIPPSPPLVQAAPRLSDLIATPLTLISGGYTTVTARFRYEDWNEDVGPRQALLWRHLEALSGNIGFYNPTREFLVDVDHRGRYGFVTIQMEFYVPSHGFGEIGLYLAIYDNSGNKGTPVSTVLTVR